MESISPIAAFAALAHDTRLAVFRRLMREGPAGLAAGALAEAVGVAASTLSFHVSLLERAGLLRSWRVGRHVFYAVDIAGTRRLIAYLTEDCCGGRPEVCAGLLDATASGEGMGEMPDKTYNVLFLCTGNSARSIIAEAVLNRIGGGRFKAYSAGSHPKGAVHDFALELLRRQNYPTAELRSKSWNEFAAAGAPELDFVFTVCDRASREPCPVWPGQPMSAHWGVPDPAEAEGTEAEKHLAFSDCMRMLSRRIEIFTSLPMASLDRLSLQRRLDEIGAAGVGAPADAR